MEMSRVRIGEQSGVSSGRPPAKNVKCPRCSYAGPSLADLEEHGQTVHDSPSITSEEFSVGFSELFVPEPTPAAAPTIPPREIGRPEIPEVREATSQSHQRPSPPEDGHPALQVPQPDPTFWVDPRVDRLLKTVGTRSDKGEIVNVLLLGPTGTGKSSLPREVAAWWQRPFYTVHCQMISELDDWWGTKELSIEEGTYFKKAALLDAVATPGCIILLDEANRTHPENLNAFFGFLDHRRRAWIPSIQKEVTVAEGVVFFLTLNEGSEYIGTNAVDRALRDRVSSTIRTDYLPKDIEVKLLIDRTGVDADTASRLCDLASTVRGNPKLDLMISTRQLLECANLLREGLPLHDAVFFSILNGAADDKEKRAILQALQVTGDIDEAYAGVRWDDDP